MEAKRVWMNIRTENNRVINLKPGVEAVLPD